MLYHCSEEKTSHFFTTIFIQQVIHSKSIANMIDGVMRKGNKANEWMTIMKPRIKLKAVFTKETLKQKWHGHSFSFFLLFSSLSCFLWKQKHKRTTPEQTVCIYWKELFEKKRAKMNKLFSQLSHWPTWRIWR